jgi:hypothetical protein
MMALSSRFSPLLAVLGVVALAGAPAALAQDTGPAGRSDTAGYRAYPADTLGSDTAQPAQPVLTDTGAAVRRPNTGGVPDTLVCTDGSSAVNASNACSARGGIDWTATQAALRARGGILAQPAESTAVEGDSGRARR